VLGAESPKRLAIFEDFSVFTKMIYHILGISAKIKPENLKQHFNWGGAAPPLATPLVS